MNSPTSDPSCRQTVPFIGGIIRTNFLTKHAFLKGCFSFKTKSHICMILTRLSTYRGHVFLKSLKVLRTKVYTDYRKSSVFHHFFEKIEIKSLPASLNR